MVCGVDVEDKHDLVEYLGTAQKESCVTGCPPCPASLRARQVPYYACR